jgi:hypothetical protein
MLCTAFMCSLPLAQAQVCKISPAAPAPPPASRAPPPLKINMGAVTLLLWRNCIRRKRAKCASCCELLSPVVIVILFALIYYAFTNKDKPVQQYLDAAADVYPLAGFGYRLELYNAHLALGEWAQVAKPLPVPRRTQFLKLGKQQSC